MNIEDEAAITKLLIIIAIVACILCVSTSCHGVDWQGIADYIDRAQPMNARQMSGRLPYLPAEIDRIIADTTDPTIKVPKRKRYHPPSSRIGRQYKVTP